MSWLASLREDIRVAKERDPAARSSLEILVTYPGIHALVIHRLAHGLAVRGWVVLPRLIAHFGRAVTGIEIHPRADIGRRLFIDMAWASSSARPPSSATIATSTRASRSAAPR